jgi:hypothetical protein
MQSVVLGSLLAWFAYIGLQLGSILWPESSVIPTEFRDAFNVNSTISPLLIPKYAPIREFKISCDASYGSTIARVGSIESPYVQFLVHLDWTDDLKFVMPAIERMHVVGLAFQPLDEEDTNPGRIGGSLTWELDRPVPGRYVAVFKEHRLAPISISFLPILEWMQFDDSGTLNGTINETYRHGQELKEMLNQHRIKIKEERRERRVVVTRQHTAKTPTWDGEILALLFDPVIWYQDPNSQCHQTRLAEVLAGRPIALAPSVLPPQQHRRTFLEYLVTEPPFVASRPQLFGSSWMYR